MKKEFKAKEKKYKKEKSEKKLFLEKPFLDLDYRFKNNTEEWFAVILQEGCDICQDYIRIQYELENVFGKSVVYFFPVYIEKVEDKLAGVVLFDGYIFVKKDETVNEGCLSRRNEFFCSILKSTKKKLTNRDINKFKTKLKKDLKRRLPKKGDTIVVSEGTFKNMQGKVLFVYKDNRLKVEFKKKTRVVESIIGIANFEKTRS